MATTDPGLSETRPPSGGRLSGQAKHWVLAAFALLLAAWGAHWLYYRWTHV